VNPIIPFAPMPGGALTANTQMMRDNNNLDKFDEVISEMTEVVKLGGYGTSVTPVSQFYWQQAYANVIFGKWKKITQGYGRMVLGYFGKTPVKPDKKIVELASKQLKLEPTDENPLDIADRDSKKSVAYWRGVLETQGIEATEENIFIAASCDKKGIAFLKGESPLMVRKKSNQDKNSEKGKIMAGSYTVLVDGKRYSVEVLDGDGEIKIEPKKEQVESKSKSVSNFINEKSQKASSRNSKVGSIEIKSQTPGTVWKILKSEGDEVEEGESILILEAMKMEIEVVAPMQGNIKTINVKQGDSVSDGMLLATME